MSYGGSLWDWNERSQCKTRFWKAPCTHPHPDALERYAQGLETAAVTDHAPQSARKADISCRESEVRICPPRVVTRFVTAIVEHRQPSLAEPHQQD
jgi:hypothetical protein